MPLPEFLPLISAPFIANITYYYVTCRCVFAAGVTSRTFGVLVKGNLKMCTRGKRCHDLADNLI